MSKSLVQADALPGFYRLLFLYAEPISAIIPAPMIWFWPGAAWFHQGQIPSIASSLSSSDSLYGSAMDPRTVLSLWHLGNCYMLIGLIEHLAFRTAVNAFRDNPVPQEQIIGAILTAMAFADVAHVLSSIIGLPCQLRSDVASWNAITHGNITFTMFVFCVRMAWFLGIRRQRYYYGQRKNLHSIQNNKNQ